MGVAKDREAPEPKGSPLIWRRSVRKREWLCAEEWNTINDKVAAEGRLMSLEYQRRQEMLSGIFLPDAQVGAFPRFECFDRHSACRSRVINE